MTSRKEEAIIQVLELAGAPVTGYAIMKATRLRMGAFYPIIERLVDRGDVEVFQGDEPVRTLFALAARKRL